jgi:hypothetical protein
MLADWSQPKATSIWCHQSPSHEKCRTTVLKQGTKTTIVARGIIYNVVETTWSPARTSEGNDMPIEQQSTGWTRGVLLPSKREEEWRQSVNNNQLDKQEGYHRQRRNDNLPSKQQASCQREGYKTLRETTEELYWHIQQRGTNIVLWVDNSWDENIMRHINDNTSKDHANN